MMNIMITDRTKAGKHLLSTTRSPKVAGVISIGSLTDHPPAGYRTFPRAKIRLHFDDITEPTLGFLPPEPEHIQRIINFGQNFTTEAPHYLLIHCWAGISRSTAAAYIVLCLTQPEVVAAREVYRLRPQAQPNILMVRLADRILGRQGRMLTALGVTDPGGG